MNQVYIYMYHTEMWQVQCNISQTETATKSVLNIILSLGRSNENYQWYKTYSEFYETHNTN